MVYLITLKKVILLSNMFNPRSIILLCCFYVCIDGPVLGLNEGLLDRIILSIEYGCRRNYATSNSSHRTIDRLRGAINILIYSFRAQVNDWGGEDNKVVQGWGVGGERAVKREFPHMALIGYNDRDRIVWLCGGILISEQFVLTAAHCFEADIYGPSTTVRLGEHDLSVTDNATLDVKIIERFRHPEYKTNLKYNDIGLFKLKHKVKFNGAIQPACLPEGPNINRNRLIATGWGLNGKVPSNILMKMTLDMFSQNECDDVYGVENAWPQGILEESQLCAGSLIKMINTCQGDSGGPIQIHRSSRVCFYTVVGLTSFGYPCHFKGLPGVYTKIYPYLKWIEGVVWPNP